MENEVVSSSPYSEEEKLTPKALSENSFVAFFQRIWRWYQGVWYVFADKHPKLSNAIYLVFFFFAFSMGVTIWQYIVMTFMPYIMAGLSSTEFVWPAVHFRIGDTDLVYAIFNEPIRYLSDGSIDPQGGLGNFIAFEIAVFTAQCINFPLQRNITYRSHGNPVVQAIWYFIGWIGVSIFTNAVWGICAPLLLDLWAIPQFIANLVKTFITGGVSMIIFFFIFLIIFPNNKKMLETTSKKLESAKEKIEVVKASGDTVALAKAEAAYNKTLRKYNTAFNNDKRFNAEKDIASLSSLAAARINGYLGMEKKLEKAKANLAAAATEDKKAKYQAEVDDFTARAAAAKETALTAVDKRDAELPALKVAAKEAIDALAALKNKD